MLKVKFKTVKNMKKSSKRCMKTIKNMIKIKFKTNKKHEKTPTMV
jgi:ribosome maturation protein Sdo1